MRWPFLAASFFLVGVFASTNAQQQTWKRQSPCDNDFSVEVPSPLYRVGWFEGKHGATFDPDEDFDQDTASYFAWRSTPAKLHFGVLVEKVSQGERSELKRLEFGGNWCMIGGDDVWTFTERIVRRNGLTGKEYVYTEAVAANRYPRGRIFYARGRLYFVIFVGTTAADLTSPDAERFLNSFRLRKVRRRNSRHARA
jgi:hypothetical protein